MSFATQVKAELAAVRPALPCCRKAQAYGMAQGGHAFGYAGISLQTESAAIAALYAELLQQVCGCGPLVRQPPAGVRGFHLVTADPADHRRIFDTFGHTGREVSLRLNRANLECEQCAAAYLRGLFLSCGTVTSPERGYHLEFCVPYYNLSRDLPPLFAECGLHVRTVRRKGDYVLYFKESEQIEDCLTFMGAVGATLELMNVKMVKDIRNKTNRVINCENANIGKTAAAAAAQLAAVRHIIQATGGLDALPPELREVARLRQDNPDMSLRELGEALDPPVSRSGVYHRIHRILAFAQEV
ncbi:MAG: DNA-binding protein WhiA [Clostridia bacterium]|nr:DNA-binding protein WhiA [Clostridia bacterium]